MQEIENIQEKLFPDFNLDFNNDFNIDSEPTTSSAVLLLLSYYSSIVYEN